jgi:hypothetical protein
MDFDDSILVAQDRKGTYKERFPGEDREALQDRDNLLLLGTLLRFQ